MGAFVGSARAAPRIAVCSAPSRAGAVVIGGCGALEPQWGLHVNPLSPWGFSSFSPAQKKGGGGEHHCCQSLGPKLSSHPVRL